jgi:hypothetical protein
MGFAHARRGEMPKAIEYWRRARERSTANSTPSSTWLSPSARPRRGRRLRISTASLDRPRRSATGPTSKRREAC